MRISRVFAALAGVVSTALAGLSIAELKNLAAQSRNNIIPLNDENYADLLNGERDYHLVLYLATDAPQINCALCREFKPDYETVAYSWRYEHPNGLSRAELAAVEDKEIPPKNIFFLSSDFMNSKKFFQIFGLDNIPKVFYFPPSAVNIANNFVSEKEDYQFFQGSHKALMFDWLEQVTGHKVNEHVPPDYAKIAINAVTTFSVALLLRKFNKQVIFALSSRTLWSGLSLVAVLLLTTGYMFNQIRGVPYVRELANGQVDYIIAGQQMQLGVETQIMSFIYGLLSLLIVVLWKRLPTIKSPSVHFFSVVIVSVMIFLAYSAMLCVFGHKGTGYPYRFVELF